MSPVSKRILMVAANPAVSTTLGGPVGFWASELFHPHWALAEAGYEVEIASPKGGAIEVDALSDPRDASGYSAHDVLSRGYLESGILAPKLAATKRVAEMRAADFDAILVCGGQSPMFTFRGDVELQSAIAGFFDAGKVVAALCHGVAALIDTKLADGSFLIAGRTITGFANVEEDDADRIVGQRVMPWRIEDATRERGANYIRGAAWKPFAVRDGRLITGQQQYSGTETARRVIEALGSVA